MEYELCKKLKEAGLSQESGGNVFPSTYYAFNGKSLRYRHGETGTEIKIPTLSELIEACPKILRVEDYFEGDFTLKYCNSREEEATKWLAGYEHTDGWYDDRVGHGATPEEAVANLYLALHPTK